MKNENCAPVVVSGHLRVNPWEGGEQQGLRRLGPISPNVAFIGQPEKESQHRSPPRSPDKAPGSQA
jgi:hypothetical protein